MRCVRIAEKYGGGTWLRLARYPTFRGIEGAVLGRLAETNNEPCSLGPAYGDTYMDYESLGCSVATMLGGGGFTIHQTRESIEAEHRSKVFLCKSHLSAHVLTRSKRGHILLRP